MYKLLVSSVFDWSGRQSAVTTNQLLIPARYIIALHRISL